MSCPVDHKLTNGTGMRAYCCKIVNVDVVLCDSPKIYAESHGS